MLEAGATYVIIRTYLLKTTLSPGALTWMLEWDNHRVFAIRPAEQEPLGHSPGFPNYLPPPAGV